MEVVVLREAGGIGDLVRMFPIIDALAREFETTWYVTSRFEALCRMCPAIAEDRAKLSVLKIEGVPRRSSRGPLFNRWAQVEAEIPYYPKGAHPPDTRTIDLFCPAFIHEIQTGARPTMDRLECWARAADVWPVKPVAPALSAFDLGLADEFIYGLGAPLDRLIAVSPVASVGVRTYRWDQIGTLVETMKSLGWFPLIFDEPGSEPSAACSHSVSENIRVQVARLSMCRAFVGPDSGFLHLALCLGVPSVGYFGPTDPEHICGCYDRRLWRACVGTWTPQITADKGCRAACYCLNAGGFKSEKCRGRCVVLESIPELVICEQLQSLLGGTQSLRLVQ